jgi:hypothetical protein
MLLKEYANGQDPATLERGGGVHFIGIWKKLAIRAVRAERSDRSIIPVRLV